MMKLRMFFLLLPVLWAAQAQAPSDRVAAVLDDWHQAASVADETRYFGHFAPDGVFMGTDAAERWTVSQFRVWARPYFAKGKAWSFKARDRHVAFSEDGKVAWFDEMLDTANLGVCRGSGVLTMVGGVWKISQYNLSVPIPNSLVDRIVKQIAGAGK